MNTYGGIIDIYQGDDIDFDQAWAGGVRVILHEATKGLFHKDTSYKARKEEALKRGFLWAGYHLCSSEDTQEQFNYFLSMEDGNDQRVGLALDWEDSNQEGIMTLDQVRTSIGLFSKKFPGRYPILSGGWILRETPAVLKGDALLGKCSLWYQHYKATPDGLPALTWPSYTFWQYDDEKKINGAPTIPGLGGEDWNRFPGTLEELQKAWPFAGEANGLGSPTPLSPQLAPVASLEQPLEGHGSSNIHSKPIVKQFIQSPNHSSRNGASIRVIVLHCTEASLQSTIDTFKDPGHRQVSAHYVIDRNGDIYQMVSDSDRANHCKGANSDSIGIEHVASDSQSIAIAQQQASVALIRWLLEQYDIPRSRILGTTSPPATRETPVARTGFLA